MSWINYIREYCHLAVGIHRVLLCLLQLYGNTIFGYLIHMTSVLFWFNKSNISACGCGLAIFGLCQQMYGSHHCTPSTIDRNNKIFIAIMNQAIAQRHLLFRLWTTVFMLFGLFSMLECWYLCCWFCIWWWELLRVDWFDASDDVPDSSKCPESSSYAIG